MKIMVVEDEVDIRDILKKLLEEQGFQVVELSDCLTLNSDLDKHMPDLVLLDQYLPGKNGLDALKEVRSQGRFSALPIIMVTAVTNQNEKIEALESGADDYVTKPFYPEELAARIRALARRSDFDSNDERGRIKSGGVSLDLASHRAFVDDKEIFLTLTEFKILSSLLQNSGTPLSRKKLLELSFNNVNISTRTIDVHMTSLRKKLGPMARNLQTIRGSGYRYRPTE